MYIREAVAVGMKAIQQGVARMRKSPQELRESASSMIKNAHTFTPGHLWSFPWCLFSSPHFVGLSALYFPHLSPPHRERV